MRFAVLAANGWLRCVPTILVMGFIFLLSHQPGDSFSLPDVVNIDKVLHCLIYTALGLTALFALPPDWRRQHPIKAGIAVVLFCLCYGVTDEFHQSFVPGRMPSCADVAADALGGLLAVVGWSGHDVWRLLAMRSKT